MLARQVQCGMPKYIEQFVDEGITPTDDFDIDAEQEKHIDRLAFEAAYSFLTRNMKRRLGQDASPRELARDKTYATRNMHGCIGLLKAHGLSGKEIDERMKKYLDDEEAKRIAAQIDWLQHMNVKITDLRNAMRLIATNAVHKGNIKDANRLVLRLENELNTTADRYERVFGPPENNTEELETL